MNPHDTNPEDPGPISRPAWDPKPAFSALSRPGLRVAILHNLRTHAPSLNGRAPSDALDELDSEKNVAAYAAALRSAGHDVVTWEGNADLAARLREHPVDICFNTCEGFRGDSREAQVPAMLEMLGIPYSGGKVLCLASTLDKAATKRILQAHGLPTPRFQEFTHPDLPLDPSLRFPLFVKPNREGTGIGIAETSRVEDEAQLRERVAYLLDAYRQTALVEEYIPGRDVTCGMVGNLDRLAAGQPIPDLCGVPPNSSGGLDWNGVHVFPISEIDYSVYPPGTEPFYSHKLKVDLADDYQYFCPSPLAEALAAEVRRLTLETVRVTQVLDFGRVDFRLNADENDKPYILEINALPGITPISDLTLCALAEGWSYDDLIIAVLNSAIARCGLDQAAQRVPESLAHGNGGGHGR